MSFLVTGDFQCDFSNLDLCSKAWDQILRLCKKYKLRTIVVCGDLKATYNPVDVRVVQWWQRAIRQAVKLGYTVICVLGNHDRIGQYTQANNWFSILRRAGAKTYDKPGIYNTGEERLFILPWDTVANVKASAKNLLKSHPDKTKDVLLFHQDISGAKYNNLGGKSDAKLSVGDLRVTSYRYTIAGHIHLPQRIEGTQTYYVGSPFCTDWGEVNQQKRYIIVGKDGLASELSTIPGWYDVSVDGFERYKPTSWTGTRIRYPVSCDASQDYGRRLEKARHTAERKYKGAEIFVVPKFNESVSDFGRSRISTSDSDEKKVREFIKQSKNAPSMVIEYMLQVLSQCEGGTRQSLSMKFLSMRAKNFLSYRTLDVDLSSNGITIIRGVNEDRGGKSNGSGKTSLLQPIPVALFGRTFKEQKHDSWASRWTKDEAYVRLKLRNHQGQIIQIKRGRRPPMLQMKKDGVDVSSGMKSNDRKEGTTQIQIEQSTGFTWQTLANAVYIDRSVANAFLSGTRKSRTEVLSRVQNLERFEKALKLVKLDITENEAKRYRILGKLNGAREAIKHTVRSIVDLKSISSIQLRNVKENWENAKKELSKIICPSNKKLVSQIHKLNKLKEKYIVSQREFEQYTEVSGRWFKVAHKKECPTCFQPVSKTWTKRYSKKVQAEFDRRRRIWDEAEKRLKRYDKKVSVLQDKEYEEQEQFTKLSLQEKTLRSQYADILAKSKESRTIKHAESRLRKLKRKKAKLKLQLKHYARKSKVYQFAAEAFSRDGIPAFLNVQLCPVLNRAASYYAELFSDNELQVRFEIEDGEFSPKIINPRGGAEIDDQSSGERALAGLISSFALREVAPKCNLLILDEPGEGLDAQTARQFARSLQDLKKRFGAIWICSHNREILSELHGERTITVRKHNRVSRLEVE
jgi:DNA repair exonuclease SbcCD ATPase subunit/DNA repair exonuclease SbcCD nuclease subunit